jgi:hypothetical protein
MIQTHYPAPHPQPPPPSNADTAALLAVRAHDLLGRISRALARGVSERQAAALSCELGRAGAALERCGDFANLER